MRFLFLLFASCGSCDEKNFVDASDVAIEIAVAPSRPPEVESLWNAAKSGEEADLARLANEEKSGGLEERAVDPALRLTAIQAMGYTQALDGLGFLGESAARDPEPLATAAVASAAMLAANPRRARDPEDALEVRRGCDALRAAKNDGARPKPVRDGAQRALAMLADLCAP